MADRQSQQRRSTPPAPPPPPRGLPLASLPPTESFRSGVHTSFGDADSSSGRVAVPRDDVTETLTRSMQMSTGLSPQLAPSRGLLQHPEDRFIPKGRSPESGDRPLGINLSEGSFRRSAAPPNLPAGGRPAGRFGAQMPETGGRSPPSTETRRRTTIDEDDSVDFSVSPVSGTSRFNRGGPTDHAEQSGELPSPSTATTLSSTTSSREATSTGATSTSHPFQPRSGAAPRSSAPPIASPYDLNYFDDLQVTLTDLRKAFPLLCQGFINFRLACQQPKTALQWGLYLRLGLVVFSMLQDWVALLLGLPPFTDVDYLRLGMMKTHCQRRTSCKLAGIIRFVPAMERSVSSYLQGRGLVGSVVCFVGE